MGARAVTTNAVIRIVMLFVFALIGAVSWGSLAKAETCVASHYGKGDGYGGRRTASGERMNPHAMTAAHRSRAFGSRVTVTNLANGKSVTVRINDRGPFIRGRCIDLSYAAFRAIGAGGTARVRVQ